MYLKEINEAFLSAFDSNSLTRLVGFALDENIEAITDASDLTSRIFYLTRWAQENDRLEELIAEAKKQSTNRKIQAIEIIPPPLIDQYSDSSILMDNHSNLEILNLRLRHMEQETEQSLKQIKEELETIKRILTGPDGANGVRGQSSANSQKIEQLQTFMKVLVLGGILFMLMTVATVIASVVGWI